VLLNRQPIPREHVREWHWRAIRRSPDLQAIFEILRTNGQLLLRICCCGGGPNTGVRDGRTFQATFLAN
jgi:hypothetical protein